VPALARRSKYAVHESERSSCRDPKRLGEFDVPGSSGGLQAQQAMQFRAGCSAGRLKVHRVHVLALAIHYSDCRRVVHCVSAILKWDFLRVDVVGLLDGHDVFGRARQTGNPRVKRGEIKRRLLRGVAFWIDGDEQNIQPVGVWPELLKLIGDLQKCGWTHIGAVGEPKEHKRRFAEISRGRLRTCHGDQRARKARRFRQALVLCSGRAGEPNQASSRPRGSERRLSLRSERHLTFTHR
jgi:hypothetical protein